jgi:hypothetical protein
MTRWQAWDARLAVPGPFHERVDQADGSKVVRWRTRSGGYGLGDHVLADLAYIPGDVPLPRTIVLTEGERAADAVAAAGYAAVGTVCGAGSTPGRSVLELFRGRVVTLWPDADAPGRRHMDRMAYGLEPLVAGLRLVYPPRGVPLGRDAADARTATIRVLVASARDVWLDPSRRAA